jgi:uncharacterized protein (UPF0332 family)
MDGREFLETATRLARNEFRADQRSAVSRAYYAAFHATRDFFEACGVRLSTHSPDAHTKLAQCMENTNVPDMVKLGRRLASLRADRNTADYRMQDTIFEKAANSNLRVRIAADIVASLDNLLADTDFGNLTSILRSKAKNLGLHVTKLSD